MPTFVPFAAEITAVCAAYPGTFPPCFLAAIKLNETGYSTDPAELQEGANPETGLLPDGTNAGRGPFQLTDDWPPNWRDPRVNADYALRHFLAPAVQFFLDKVPGIGGDELVKCAAAAYNAGELGAWMGFETGSVDRLDTNGYGARAIHNFAAISNGRRP